MDASIKYKYHFKLHVLFKDTIIFEWQLMQNEISFYKEHTQVGDCTVYFLEDNDRVLINQILIDNEIIASTDTIALTDYNDAKKVYKLYFGVSAIVVIIMILIIIFE